MDHILVCTKTRNLFILDIYRVYKNCNMVHISKKFWSFHFNTENIIILSKFRQKLDQLVHHSTNYFASFIFGFQSCKDLVFMPSNLTFYSTWLTSFSRICIFCNSLYLSVLKLCWKSYVIDTYFKATLIPIINIKIFRIFLTLINFYSLFLSFVFNSKFHNLWIDTSSFDFW